MMNLPFKCQTCKHEFTTIDEHLVLCPECKSSDVVVQWKEKKELEQAQVESLFEHRRHTTDFSSGEDLAKKAKESFRARNEDSKKTVSDEDKKD